jgi:predicted O-methyltransferase YrrM
MGITLWTEIDQYYQDLLTRPDPALEKAKMTPDLPDISLSSTQGRFLEIMVRSLGAKHVLEIGTLGGYSTAWLARGLPYGARLISLEIDPERAKLARENLNLFEFKAKVEVWVGDALHNMAEMTKIDQPPFDLIFIDGEKSQYTDYLDLSIQLSHPGTLIIADNVIKHGRIFNQEINTPSRIGITTFHEKVAAHPRLQAAVLQTVGEKGHDGFSFILVKEEE